MKGQRGWAAPLTQCLACIAGSLLALLAALNMTLFREGYYINRLEKSTCLQAITENILQAGQTVAQTAGLRQDILDSLVTLEDVQVAVLRRADEIWHGATTQPDSPYSDVVAYLQDTVSKETGEMWDDTDVNLYTSIRAVCDDMWRSNAVPPMANVLNLLMQYRRVAAPLTIVLVAVLLGCLWLQVPLSRNWRGLFGALFAIGTGILVTAGIKAGLEGLAGQIPGLVDIHVQTEGLPSSNADVMLDSTITDEASLKGYSVHPAHVAVADGKVRPYTANRVCLDFEV